MADEAAELLRRLTTPDELEELAGRGGQGVISTLDRAIEG